MTLELGKNFIPIFVVITSAIFAFILNRLTEKNKKITTMVEDSLDIHISKMYKEVVEITNVYMCNVYKIKKFIIYYSSKNDLHKLHEDQINFNLLDLSIKIRTNTITESELIKDFKNLSKAIEANYWERTKFTSNDLKWSIKKKVSSKWYIVTLSIFFNLKDFFEYLSIISVLLLVISFVDKIRNTGLILHEIHEIVTIFSILILPLYIGLIILYHAVSEDKKFNKKRLIK